jgi:branched-chain amino acid transport system ATP-binding protein
VTPTGSVSVRLRRAFRNVNELNDVDDRLPRPAGCATLPAAVGEGLEGAVERSTGATPGPSTDPAVAHPTLAVGGLDAWYGQAQVLYGIDLTVEASEIVGIFGHNGAGKSTLLRSIVRVHLQTRGEIRFGSRRLDGLRSHEVALAGCTLAREGAPVFETMTVDEHIRLGQRLAQRAGRGERTRDEVYATFPLLAERRSSAAGYLSGGQRQALVLATAFASAPACLLLDEPSTGLAPLVAEDLYRSIAALAEQGVAFLIAEQNPMWLAAVSTRGYLLETGHVAAEGEPSTFVRHAGAK